MKEHLITNEIALLAESKGFDRFELQAKHQIILSDGSNYYPAITLSFMQQWLREVHNIYVSVVPSIHTGENIVKYWYPTLKNCTIDLKYKFDTYEEALAQGLIDGLKLIKDI